MKQFSVQPAGVGVQPHLLLLRILTNKHVLAHHTACRDSITWKRFAQRGAGGSRAAGTPLFFLGWRVEPLRELRGCVGTLRDCMALNLLPIVFTLEKTTRPPPVLVFVVHLQVCFEVVVVVFAFPQFHVLPAFPRHWDETEPAALALVIAQVAVQKVERILKTCVQCFFGKKIGHRHLGKNLRPRLHVATRRTAPRVRVRGT